MRKILDTTKTGSSTKGTDVKTEIEDSARQSRRSFLANVGLGMAAAAVCGCNGAFERTRAVRNRPNVILIITDDQGYGDLSLNGNPVLKTPNLDKLASESVRLTDFHVAPICSPTRSQLLTGQDALRNGAFSWAYSREMIRQGIPTIADIFGANGYRTGHFGKWHLGDNYAYRPQDRGFDETIHHGGAAISQSTDYWDNDYFDDYYSHNGLYRKYKGYCTDVWFDQTMKFIERCRRKSEPFFIYLPTNAAHEPLYVPDIYCQPYLSEGPYLSKFYGMIANIDENMGRLKTFLEKTGLRDDTVIVWLTDNGAPRNATKSGRVHNAGMRGRKASLYDGGHRVPCFIRWPNGNLRGPCDVDQLTQCQDILPTLVELCGLSTPPNAAFDGASLVGLLTDGSAQIGDRMLVVQCARKPMPDKWDSAVLWNKWRLVHGKELYNIRYDPGQSKDVSREHPDVFNRMREHYEKWWAQIGPTLSEVSPIVVGSDKENPTSLRLFDWFRVEGHGNVTGQNTVRMAAAINGPWKINVARAGRYRVALRRWPVEAVTALGDGLPAKSGFEDTFPEGKALPIAGARLKVRSFDKTLAVSGSELEAVFDVELESGPATLQTWFLDDDGEELCGAYYVYVKRM
ncbi:MAG: arylsulfatase [Planctomycetota bacterium]